MAPSSCCTSREQRWHRLWLPERLSSTVMSELYRECAGILVELCDWLGFPEVILLLDAIFMSLYSHGLQHAFDVTCLVRYLLPFCFDNLLITIRRLLLRRAFLIVRHCQADYNGSTSNTVLITAASPFRHQKPSALERQHVVLLMPSVTRRWMSAGSKVASDESSDLYSTMCVRASR